MSISYLNTIPKTPVYHKLATSVLNTDKFLIFIPGNPGLVNFYLSYLDAIQAHFSKIEILCIGHAGFAPKSNCWTTYDINYQVKHKYNILRNLIDEKFKNGIKPQFYILSHSMGSYVVQRTLKMLFEDDHLLGKFEVQFSGFITPTIYDIKSSDSGVVLSRMMFWYVPIIYLALIFKFIVNLLLPESIIRKILHHQLISSKMNYIVDVEPGVNLGFENSVDGGYDLIKHANIINQALTMAKEEMTRINKDDSINDWYFNDTKFAKWCFFAKHDHWVSESSRNYLITKYGSKANVKMDICGNIDQPISHSFCVTQSKEFSEITVEKMGEYTKD